MHKPRDVYLKAILRVLIYIKSFLGKGSFYKKYGYIHISTFPGAEYAGSESDKKSNNHVKE